jgi:hypothetical protein
LRDWGCFIDDSRTGKITATSDLAAINLKDCQRSRGRDAKAQKIADAGPCSDFTMNTSSTACIQLFMLAG